MPNAVVIGSSDGIGLALAELLVAQGWRVTGLSRSASTFAAPSYKHHVVDVCSQSYRQRLAEVASETGDIDVCVYCVGIGEFLDLQVLGTDRQVFETSQNGEGPDAAFHDFPNPGGPARLALHPETAPAGYLSETHGGPVVVGPNRHSTETLARLTRG